MEQKFCSSCSRTKPAGDFLHPIKGTPGKTCAACIVKKNKGASTSAGVDATATLQLHTIRLDNHEGRIKSVEETLYDYDAAGAPPAPDAPGAGDGTFTKSQLKRQRRKNRMAARAAARALDVLIGDDAASDSTDLDSLASTHSCVRALVEENRQLTADLRGTRGMRLLLRDPSFLQRVGRGMVGRSRAKSWPVPLRRGALYQYRLLRPSAFVHAPINEELTRSNQPSLASYRINKRITPPAPPRRAR